MCLYICACLHGASSLSVHDERVPHTFHCTREHQFEKTNTLAAISLLLCCIHQGVRAVIAESYERIHRSNLLGMGIVPLQYLPGQTAESLGLTGKETYTISMPDNLTTGQILDVQVCVCVCVCVSVCVCV